MKTFQSFFLLPPGAMQQFYDFYEEATAEDPIYCSYRKCSKFIRMDYVNPKNETVCCPKCLGHTCVVCRKHSHEGVCIEGMGMKGMVQRHKLQQCPRCKIAINRIAGCKVMHCRCGQRFCYICGKRLKKHSCNCGNDRLWDRDEEID